ncbi:MAG TPA: chemotaxis protein CheB [Polyangiaceae bacterium]|jgi:two-component system chemotaxis response regulator CheB|nr:chemotaxis protein CheB [Polyangiaceae bacterium]
MLTAETNRLLASRSALVLGASAGAVDALSLLLPGVPEASRIPVVVVVHLPPNRPSLLPELFTARCAARVREPEDKEPVSGGIWFAPSNYHLLIERDRTFSLSVDEPVNFSRPSIDVLFESAAECFGDELCAIVLTGANDDGAFGASAVRQAGGLVIVQDPHTAEAKQMPQAAISRAKPQIVASLSEIADFIHQATKAAP